MGVDLFIGDAGCGMVMAKYIGGCLGVNYMSNTFDVSLRCRRRLGSGGVGILLLLVSIWQCVDLCSGKETVLLPFLKTKNEKILLRMLQQTNYHVKYERFVNGKLMECISPLKNDLTKSSSSRIIPLSVSLDFAKTLSLHSSQPYDGLSPAELEETRRVDLILDLVQGICLYYSTYTFIYEYCHKEHVRQFDNLITKTQNHKPHFEDISMGVYNPMSYADRPTKLNIRTLTEEEKAARIPEVSVFSAQYRHMSAEHNDNHLGAIEFQEGFDGRTLHSNAHITSNNIMLQMPIFLTITCEDHSNGQSVKVNNYAIMVSSYDLVYTKKNGNCDRYLTYERLSTTAKYFPDSDPQPIRVIGSFIYGHVEERCTQNLEWERPGKEKKQHHLKAGSVLLLELHNFKDKILQLHYVTVKQVFSGELIEIESPIGKSFYRERKEDVQFTDYIPNRLISNVTHCQVLFEQPVNFQQATTGNQYISSHIMKLNQTQNPNLEDARLACFCKINQDGTIKVIDMEVKVGSKLWADHYTTFVKTNTNIYNPHLFKDLMFTDCDDIACVPFLQLPAQAEQIKGKKFTKLIRFNSAHKQQTFTSTSREQIFAITIRKAGILRLITTDIEGNVYIYLLSEGQIIKMRQYANGTKQIIKQNKYYENATLPNDQSQNNIIYLHITILPNGTYMGAIWKYKDYIQFPRFLFYNQRMSKFDLVAGVADVRVLDTGKMRRKDSLVIKQFPRILERQEFIKRGEARQSEAQKIVRNQKLNEKKDESLLLTRSHSINYTYVSGEYCGQPINKYRQTIVTIKCGKPWLQITKLLETSPCEYWLQIESSLLCEQNYKTVVERDEDIPNKSQEDQIVFNGLLCLPATGLFDEAYQFLHFGAFDEKDIEVTVGRAKEQNQRRGEDSDAESPPVKPQDVAADEK